MDKGISQHRIRIKTVTEIADEQAGFRQGMSGVAVWIYRKIAGALVGYEPISDRVPIVRLRRNHETLA